MMNDVLLQLLLTLLNNKKMTSSQLAERFEVSTRTINRYISILSSCNIPIISVCGSGGGYSIADNYKLSSMYFTTDEYQLLIDGVNSIPLPNKKSKIDDITNKLLALNKSCNRQYLLRSDQLFISADNSSEVNAKVSLISQCVYSDKCIDITYHSINGEITTRTIEPHSLTITDGMWYLYAFCNLRNSFRIFKIARIATIIVGDSFIRKPIDLMDRVSRLDDLAKFNDRIEIILQVQPTFRTIVEEWLGIESISTKNDKIIATATINNDISLIGKLLSLSSGVKVLFPSSLIEKIVGVANETTCLYKIQP